MELLLGGERVGVDLVVFDCDGVLLNTMPEKIRAFEQWIPAMYAEHRGAYMEMVMAGFGKSRARHIRNFYEEILGLEVDTAFLEAEVARFTEICEPLCAGARWCVGSREFVAAVQAAGVTRYVLSGTPQAPLESMLESAGGTELFDVIIGSPPAKPESMDRILAETGVTAKRTLFIGDANADQEAALHVGAHFVYFPSEAQRPLAPIVTEVGDLRELLLG